MNFAKGAKSLLRVSLWVSQRGEGTLGGRFLVINPFFPRGEKPGLRLEILSALIDRAGRPLLTKGGNSSGLEFLGWASLDFITCQVPFSAEIPQIGSG